MDKGMHRGMSIGEATGFSVTAYGQLGGRVFSTLSDKLPPGTQITYGMDTSPSLYMKRGMSAQETLGATQQIAGAKGGLLAQAAENMGFKVPEATPGVQAPKSRPKPGPSGPAAG